MPDRESAGYILGETTHLIRANLPLVLAALTVMCLVGLLSDLYPDFAGLVGLASILVNLVAQYETTSALLVHYGLVDSGPRRRRLWALLGLNIVSGFGILFGLVFLIVPGAYLFVRWSASAPALIAEEAGVTESLGLSAMAVAGRFWQSSPRIWCSGRLSSSSRLPRPCCSRTRA